MSDQHTQIKSMTGYGQGGSDRNGARLEVELRGVNHRYFDLKLRLPSALAPYEAEVRKRVQKRVRRGRIDIAVTQVPSRPPSYRVEVNSGLIRGYLEAAGALKKEFRLRGSLELRSILGLPGAISIQEESSLGVEVLGEMLWQSLGQALQAYETMRTEEGRRLAVDIHERLAMIAKEVREIEQAVEGLPAAYTVKIKERVARLLEGQRELDPSRLAQEVALLAGRVDITEEIVRLLGYLEQARGTLDGKPGPVGKELDFVMQEMNREANTISSKSESLPICQAALRVRSAVEKIREQVQNVE